MFNDDMSEIPDRLVAALADRYRIEREVGAGGMATVYLAHDLRHDRPVAIKVLKPELAAAIGADRFLAEIRTTANLQHPHILPLFDSGEAGGFLFYVMPYVEGETLRARLSREKQLSIAMASRIATEVASALDYAHRHGVIHRDIKPENILLHDGAALVADFGIALAVSAARTGERITQTGMSVGTPQYMSPEQASGERDITGRADIYALGAVTYEMLVGEPPFTGPSTQTIVAKIMTEDPRRLIPQRRSIPPALEDAVLTSLEKLPADRFESAADFARAMTGDQSARRASGRRDSAAPSRRGLLLSIAGAAAIIAIAFFAGRRFGRPGLPIASFGRSTKVTWDRGMEIEPAISPDGRYVAYAAGTTASMRIFIRQVAGGRPTQLTDDSLALQTNPSWSSDGSRILFLSGGGVFSAPSSGGPARPEMQRATQGPIVSAVWSPDGASLAYSVGDTVYIRSSDGRVRPLARILEASLCQWSPNAELIACASGNSYYSRLGFLFGNLSPSRVVVTRVRDGTESVVSDAISVNQCPTWSHDGRWLYFVSSRMGPRDIYAVRISRDGRADDVPERLTIGLNPHSISLSASSTRFAYDVYTGTSNISSLPFPPNGATEANATPVTAGAQVIEGIMASQDGKWIFYSSDVSGNSDVYRQRLPVGVPEQLTSDPADDFSPVPSPDGREVAFHSWRSGTRDIYILSLDGGPVRAAASTPAQESQPNWAPDGRALTFAMFPSNGVWVVRKNASGNWGTAVERAPRGGWPIWSPDGKWNAYSTYFLGGSLMVMNPDSGAPRMVLDSANSAGAPVEMPLWSGDSKTLYFKSHDPQGNASFWSIPLGGGKPTLLLRFNDPARPSYRAEWSIAAGKMYFTINDRQSDVWVMEVMPR
jgi:Tol biopolymer transport system component